MMQAVEIVRDPADANHDRSSEVFDPSRFPAGPHGTVRPVFDALGARPVDL